MAKTYNFKEVEEKILQKWKEEDTYKKSSKRNEGKKKFYFLQGPPYTSGNIHIGHALNKILKKLLIF